MKSPTFRTRLDADGFARFYFSDESEASAFAACHNTDVFMSSPITAGGGLWRVKVPYTPGEAICTPAQQIAASIELGRICKD